MARPGFHYAWFREAHAGLGQTRIPCIKRIGPTWTGEGTMNTSEAKQAGEMQLPAMLVLLEGLAWYVDGVNMRPVYAQGRMNRVSNTNARVYTYTCQQLHACTQDMLTRTLPILAPYPCTYTCRCTYTRIGIHQLTSQGWPCTCAGIARRPTLTACAPCLSRIRQECDISRTSRSASRNARPRSDTFGCQARSCACVARLSRAATGGTVCGATASNPPRASQATQPPCHSLPAGGGS